MEFEPWGGLGGLRLGMSQADLEEKLHEHATIRGVKLHFRRIGILAFVDGAGRAELIDACRPTIELTLGHVDLWSERAIGQLLGGGHQAGYWGGPYSVLVFPDLGMSYGFGSDRVNVIGCYRPGYYDWMGPINAVTEAADLPEWVLRGLGPRP